MTITEPVNIAAFNITYGSAVICAIHLNGGIGWILPGGSVTASSHEAREAARAMAPRFAAVGGCPGAATVATMRKALEAATTARWYHEGDRPGAARDTWGRNQDGIIARIRACLKLRGCVA